MSIFSFDVETIGLYGEVFAVGAVILSNENKEINSLFLRADDKLANGFDDDRKWIRENVIPNLYPINCTSLYELRNKFWEFYTKCLEKYPNIIFIADCSSPCESGFLRACIMDDFESRKWKAPFPLHEIGTALYLCGKNPQTYQERQVNELPIHNPVNDARQSARIWLDCKNYLQT